MKRKALYSVLGILSSWSWLGHAATSTPDWNTWPEQDVSAETAQVNDGELHFLHASPQARVHHHHNAIVISPKSLRDGWISLSQCHNNLDAVPRSEVVFRKDRTRNLTVLSHSDIDRVRVEGNTVQLTHVGRRAQLCVSVETQTLTENGDGTYSLHNGPFMRRFLDGYYPMRVSMDISFSGTGLRFIGIHPPEQQGFSVREDVEAVHLDTWFEGRLKTEVQFAPR